MVNCIHNLLQSLADIQTTYLQTKYTQSRNINKNVTDKLASIYKMSDVPLHNQHLIPQDEHYLRGYIWSPYPYLT